MKAYWGFWCLATGTSTFTAALMAKGDHWILTFLASCILSFGAVLLSDVFNDE